MTPNVSQVSTKKIATTATSLDPSALVVLYEIDLSELLINNERRVFTDGADFNQVLRFHNNLKLIQTSIFFDQKEYYPAPIKTDGFEVSVKGSPPTPKLSITFNFDGLPQDTADRIKYLKAAVRDLDSLAGAKVTRIRTFAKYIDGYNFYDNYGTSNQKLKSNILVPPEDFDPDPNAQFPQDVYYIDRKSAENKNTVEFELASPFDLQDLKLPGRIVTENACIWTYRGEGCCYEYNTIKKTKIGEIHHNDNSNCKATPTGNAPPIATGKNELIVGADGLIEMSSLNNSTRGLYVPGGLWNRNAEYIKGDYIRIEVGGVNYYFVSKTGTTSSPQKGNPPPNQTYWIADECSKTMAGCRLRWSEPLPIGAFPTSRRGGTE